MVLWYNGTIVQWYYSTYDCALWYYGGHMTCACIYTIDIKNDVQR